MLLPTHSEEQSGNVWHEPDGPHKDAVLVELRLGSGRWLAWTVVAHIAWMSMRSTANAPVIP